MMTKRKSTKPGAEKTVRDIRRVTRRKYSAEEKIRIVMEGLRAEDALADRFYLLQGTGVGLVLSISAMGIISSMGNNTSTSSR